MYDRTRIARATGGALATWALIGLIVMSSGVAYAVPVAGIGGFVLSADDITADNMVLLGGYSDTETTEGYPQAVVELRDTEIQRLQLQKTMDIGIIPGMTGNFRLMLLSQGTTNGDTVMMKTSGLASDRAEFNGFVADDLNNSDPRAKHAIQSNGTVQFSGSGARPVRIRAHFMASDSIQMSDFGMVACYDPDNDTTYEWGPC